MSIVNLTPDEMNDILESKIAEIQNENYADPRVQELLNFEAEIVLQEYYQSDEYLEVQENEWLSDNDTSE